MKKAAFVLLRLSSEVKSEHTEPQHKPMFC